MLFTDKLSTPYIEDLELGDILVSDLIQNVAICFIRLIKRLRLLTMLKGLYI